jgi:hypothetical protein
MEDQEDRHRVEMGPLPGGAGVQIEDPVAALAAVVDDRGVGATTVDVETLTGGAAGAGQTASVEQVHELLVASGLVHQIVDREIHRFASLGDAIGRPDLQETRRAGG